MNSTSFRVHGALVRWAVRTALLAGLALPVGPAFATCSDAGATRTCVPGAGPDMPRAHAAPTTTTLLIQSPSQFSPVFMDSGLSFTNPGASTVLTLIATG